MGYRMRYAAIILAVSLVFVLAGCANVGSSTNGWSMTPSEDEEPLRLYVVMETTSDWTDFVLPDNVDIQAGLITSYSEAAQPSLNRERLALHQPIEAAQRGESVTVEACVSIDPPDENLFEFGVMRGHLGATTVRLYEVVDCVAEPIDEYWWAEIDDTTESNISWFRVDWTTRPLGGGIERLPYPTDTLDDMTDRWVTALRERDGDALVELFAPESVSVFAGLYSDEYLVENSQENVRAECADEPIPGFDYSLITYTPPIRFATRWESAPQYLIIGSYDGDPGGSDMFRFREIDGEWKIVHHVWKPSYEIRPE